jgi:hypothetical protein
MLLSFLNLQGIILQVAMATSILAANIGTGNNNTIVMVHGLWGWGEATPHVNNSQYFKDNVPFLRNNNFTVVVPGLGPLSSNWYLRPFDEN